MTTSDDDLNGRHSATGDTDWAASGWPTTVLPAVVVSPAVDVSPVTVAAESTGDALPSRTTVVSCPECGAAAMIDPTRRDAQDFCAHCDFPLFWARNDLVLADPFDGGGGASRRLPGTVGRVATASISCPHCTEPNLPTAQICIRCGLSMQIQAPPPPPPPPVPEPVYVPEPEVVKQPSYWWLWLLGAVAAAILVFVVVSAIRN
jgi:hypothetical protein